MCPWPPSWRPWSASYELLIFNALFTFIGLCLLIKKEEK